MTVYGLFRVGLLVLFLLAAVSCTVQRNVMWSGPGMGSTGMPSAMDFESTRGGIERKLAREIAGKRAPHPYQNWHDYWTDCLWHWHFTEPGGNRWLEYTIHRRGELHLPAIWNWS